MSKYNSDGDIAGSSFRSLKTPKDKGKSLFGDLTFSDMASAAGLETPKSPVFIPGKTYADMNIREGYPPNTLPSQRKKIDETRARLTKASYEKPPIPPHLEVKYGHLEQPAKIGGGSAEGFPKPEIYSGLDLHYSATDFMEEFEIYRCHLNITADDKASTYVIKRFLSYPALELYEELMPCKMQTLYREFNDIYMGSGYKERVFDRLLTLNPTKMTARAFIKETKKLAKNAEVGARTLMICRRKLVPPTIRAIVDFGQIEDSIEKSLDQELKRMMLAHPGSAKVYELTLRATFPPAQWSGELPKLNWVQQLNAEDGLSSFKQKNKKLLGEVSVRGKHITFLLDTGAQISIMSGRLAEELGITSDPTEVVRLRSYHGQVETAPIAKNVELNYLGKLYNLDLVISKVNTEDLILGMDWVAENNITLNWSDTKPKTVETTHDNLGFELQSDFAIGKLEYEGEGEQIPVELLPNQKRQLEALLEGYAGTFAKETKDLTQTTLVEHKIETSDADPINLKPYRLANKVREKHREGKKNPADFLSRFPWEEKDLLDSEAQVLALSVDDYDLYLKYAQTGKIPEVKEGNSGWLEVAKHLTWENDKLWKSYNNSRVWFVPPDRVLEVIGLFHAEGHLREKKLLEKLKPLFYIPDVKKEIKQFIQSCRVCQAHQQIERKTTELKPIYAKGPFALWGIDVAGPINPVSNGGNKQVTRGDGVRTTDSLVESGESLEKHFKELKKYLPTIWKDSEERNVAGKAYDKARYDRDVTPRLFRNGDLVLLKSGNKRGTFGAEAEGPYRVLRPLGDGRYRLLDFYNKAFDSHSDRLVPFSHRYSAKPALKVNNSKIGYVNNSESLVRRSGQVELSP
ncbi:hypothetical protein BB561_005666 [Smittium simulii]|uniref:Integrase zinc-binding domain-containing protein n=1 Tax=Smittium simulii TaxID=133385 RepID=A0A2T9Y951_9FUNG|nr:hypothetical protein BB561_005666 [Smittium simulii]